MFQGSPYAYHVLSSVANAKDDIPAAQRYWAKVIEVAGTDTNYRDLRQSAMFNIGVTKAVAVEAATGEQQKTLAKDAAAALQAFIAAAPGSQDLPRAQSALARMLLLTGDKAAVRGTYADQLANPDKHSDLDLTQAGVIASQAGDTANAAKLFEAALAQNPYSRDALNNLSATLLQLKQFDKIVPVARRLVAIDPSNGDNYAFLSLAYNGLANSAAAGAKKALNDSAFKYYQQSEQLPVKVTFTEFTRGESRAVVGMQVEGMQPAAAATPATPAPRAGARPGARPAPAAAKPSAAPKTYNVTLEFLDKNGNVIDTKTESVGPVGPGDKKTARFETTKPGVAGFRYQPLS
jgi:tetratricopeptide (TPR) repeat protein